MGLDIVPPEVRTRVARVLLDRNTRGINFTLGKVSISGDDYETIAILISMGMVSVAFGQINDLKGSGGVAYYTGAGAYSNVLYLPRSYQAANLSLDARSVIIHEATHAILDYKRRALRRLDSEMLAYFAQFWYAMANGFIYNLTDVDDRKSAVIAHGTFCVEQYQQRAGSIEKEALENFRKAIKAVPLYGDADSQWSAGDGIRGIGTTDPIFRAHVLGGLSDPD